LKIPVIPGEEEQTIYRDEECTEYHSRESSYQNLKEELPVHYFSWITETRRIKD